jgi:enoyl-CoA hydratase
MTKTKVRTEIEGPHATVTLYTEEGINVMSTDAMGSLREALAKVAKDANVRTTAIVGEGKVFAAGADIKAMAAFKPAEARAYASLGQDVLNELESLPSLTVAAINGAALGGGLELALACDFRIAVKSAKVGLPETSLGLIPGWAGIMRLTKLVGASQAKRLFLSALPVSAEDGLAFGLVDEIVNAAEDLKPRVTAFCKSFRRGAPAAVALAKRAFRDGDDVSAFGDCFNTEDAREGIAAFIEKRPASWMEPPA